MASTFTIESTIQVIPLEEITFTDTTQKAKSIHSSIDKICNSSTTSSHGSVSTNIAYSSYTLEANDTYLIPLSSILGITGTTLIKSLFIKCLVLGDHVPDISNPYDGSLMIIFKKTVDIITFDISTVGSYIMLPITTNLQADQIYLSTASIENYNIGSQVEILYGI